MIKVRRTEFALNKRLISEDAVDLVLSPYGTPLTLVASEVTEQYGYVMVACAAAGERIWDRGYENIFGMHALSKRYFLGFLDLAARHGLETTAILFEKTAFNITAAKGARDWAERFGLRIGIYKGFDDPDTELNDLLDETIKK